MTINSTKNQVGTIVGGKPSATLHLVQSSRFARRFARLLLVGLVVSVFAMSFLPWQQTSRGSGQVIAYVPQERQQSIDAQTKGVVVRVAKGLIEGSEVKEGEFILELQPFSPDLVEQLEDQMAELKTKEETLRIKAEAYRDNVIAFTEAKEFTVDAAEQMIESAKAKLESKQNLVSAYVAKELQARLNYERQRDLENIGLKPEKEIEKLKKEWDVASAELESIGKEVFAYKMELAAKRSKLEESRRVAQTKIDYAVAMEQDALGNAATIRKEIGAIKIKLGETGRLEIRATRDGTIFRMPVYERGQVIKEGESILTLVPKITQKAVELYINGNDMPLVQVDQEVRLQFEGWPAVQFAGWPSIAVGTFSGKVATVDSTDNGKGQFRILIIPNEEEQVWPSEQYLRQGVRANGWVMLRQVSLGYELWRQLNGFPVIVSTEEPKKDKVKPPKLPK